MLSFLRFLVRCRGTGSGGRDLRRHGRHPALPWSLRLGLLVAGFLLVPGLSAGKEDRDDLTYDVLACENAVAKLEQCCPSFPARNLSCVDERYDREGCGTRQRGRELPSFDDVESSCLLETPCPALIERGICKRAAEAQPRGFEYSTDLDTGATSTINKDDRPRVCP